MADESRKFNRADRLRKRLCVATGDTLTDHLRDYRLFLEGRTTESLEGDDGFPTEIVYEETNIQDYLQYVAHDKEATDD